MHLLLAQKGSISKATRRSDLGQSAGDILFLSAADTEIASVAAVANRGELRWRLVNLASLKHPMSIDMWIDKTALAYQLVVLRALGGGELLFLSDRGAEGGRRGRLCLRRVARRRPAGCRARSVVDGCEGGLRRALVVSRRGRRDEHGALAGIGGSVVADGQRPAAASACQGRDLVAGQGRDRGRGMGECGITPLSCRTSPPQGGE